jgi:putative transposase
LRKLQRKLDRQRYANNPDNYNENGTSKKGKREWIVSNKMRKTEKQIQKIHNKITNIRSDISHKMTTSLTNEYGIICIEDLNVKGMMSNHKLAKSVGDAAFYEKRRQLEYKSQLKGGMVSVVSQWFPSSKLCSNKDCDYKNTNLSLSDRKWICPNCEQENERDLNAAINIKQEGVKLLCQ